MTFPRFRGGIPVTLGTRSLIRSQDGSQLIDPFPDISWHMNPTQDCDNRMVSVFRVAVSFLVFFQLTESSYRLNLQCFIVTLLKIDECNRLWIVDTGKIGLGSAPFICAPKILVFNLLNNQLIHRYIIPRNQYVDNSLFINPVSDE